MFVFVYWLSSQVFSRQLLWVTTQLQMMRMDSGFCIKGIPKKTHFQNAAGATVHWLNHHLPAPLVSGD